MLLETFIPQTEPELVELPFLVRPPSFKPWRQDDPRRPTYFAMGVSRIPALKDLGLFDEDDSDDEILEQAIGFRNSGRQGLYVAHLVYLGMKRHPLACLLLAGILAQAAKQKDYVLVPNKWQRCRRAVGWLAAANWAKFDDDFGFDADKLIRFRANIQKKSVTIEASISRQIELNERRITVIRNPIRRFRSDSTTSDRYLALNAPISLAGNIDTRNAADLLKDLREEYPWANDLLSEIETAMALSVAGGRPWLSIPPILIVGQPGIGKTRFVRRLSELSGIPLETIHGAGSSDNRDFAGTSRGWSSAHPGRIVEIFCDTKVANPIVLVDELDKIGGGERNGQTRQTLLAMLEPETRDHYFDEALSAHVDLSFVNWIFTANSTKDLGRPLLSRVRIVHMPAPSASHAPQILKSAMRDLSERYGWSKEAMPELDPKVQSALLDSLSKGASPRTLVAMLEQVFAIEVKWRRSL